MSVAAAAYGTYSLSKVTPTGSPGGRSGAFFIVVQLPDGASVGRTSDVVRRAEAILKDEETVADYTAVIGLNFIDNYSQGNSAFFVVTLKPFAERKGPSDGAAAIIVRLGQKFREIEGGPSSPLPLPRLSGLGPAAGSHTCCKTSAAATQRNSPRPCAA